MLTVGAAMYHHITMTNTDSQCSNVSPYLYNTILTVGAEIYHYTTKLAVTVAIYQHITMVTIFSGNW